MIRLALLCPLALAACQSGPPPLPPPDVEVRPVTADDRLDGRWAIVAVNGRAASQLFADFHLSAAPPRIAVQLGCNSGSGGAVRNGDKLFITDLGTTEMACDPGRMQLDAEMLGILREPMTMELSPPNGLRLVNAGGTLDLVRQRN